MKPRVRIKTNFFSNFFAHPCTIVLIGKNNFKTMIFSSIKKFINFPPTAFCLSGPAEAVIDEDVTNKQIKTVKSFVNYVDKETGMDRIKRMFQLE